MSLPLRRLLGAAILAGTVGTVALSTYTERTTVGSTFTVGFSRAARLADGSDDTILQAAAMLKGHPELKAVITGYTQPGGDAAADQSLSDARASAAADALEADGVDPSRVTASGAGGASPPARVEGESDAEWQHRMARAEIKVER